MDINMDTETPEAKKQKIIQRASLQQYKASNPNDSVWVSASAGTGKTKVLTDRVLRILLSGTNPEKILCLTFTKAAAAEMSNRIAAKLSLWATLDDEKLEKEIKSLSGSFPDDEKKAQDIKNRARKLFAILLDTAGGMRIQTIHSFCQTLLKRFPLEAGISPSFEVMDDRNAKEVLRDAKISIFSKASTNKELKEALLFITNNVHETNFPDLMEQLISSRSRLFQCLEKYKSLEKIHENLCKNLKIETDDTEETIIKKACQNRYFDYETLKEIAENVSTDKFSRNPDPSSFYDFINSDDIEKRCDIFYKYTKNFLTLKLLPKSAFLKKAVKEEYFHSAMEDEALRIVSVLNQINSCKVAYSSKAIATIAFSLIEEYNKYKEKNSILDYNDLILLSRKLLENEQSAAWVLFKLDGGIDHILIDEAQDTSPDQWAIVKAILEEFFAGMGAKQTNRTVFVVGDRKQSIYSFQGADPKEFENTKKLLSEKISDIGKELKIVDLNTSFRSTEAVLHAVNAVFELDLAKKGVVLEGEDITHYSSRVGDAGLVELMPPVKPLSIDSTSVWKPPVERISGDSTQNRTAYFTAKKIHKMISSKEVLPSKGRPVRPSDFMVLVQRRTPFVNSLVKELKKLNIEVAGVDRMVLSKQIAVMDLIALGEFLLLPEDDLTLATILKSPLIGIGEQELFNIAYGRKNKSLWFSLSDKARELGGIYNHAYKVLSSLLSITDKIRPFELYSYVLTNLDGKKNLLKRLGTEACDPIDEFMNLVLSYETSHIPSLQGFIHWIKGDDATIKRELDQGEQDAVRIMTVHGSKGLQAPIVILPNTLQKSNSSPDILFDENNLFYWPIKAENYDDYCKNLKENYKQSQDEESKRLLYVAMTRAEDRLYITGWHNKTSAPSGTWYEIIGTALDSIGNWKKEVFANQVEYGNYPENVLFYETEQNAEVKQQQETLEKEHRLRLPEWLSCEPEPEPTPPKPLTPSKPDEDEPAVNSPLGEDDGYRYFRGNLIHKMLEILPDIAAKDRENAGENFLSKFAPELSEQKRKLIIKETLSVINNDKFNKFFEKGSKAEVPVVGLVDGKVLSGIIDRILVTEDEVYIIDYKTNRPPPREVEDIPKVYLDQLSIYKKALSNIYKGKKITCALLWTDIPLLMPVPNDMLDA
jgi:ATP-dependent helicase/nuclease subunit A